MSNGELNKSLGSAKNFGTSVSQLSQMSRCPTCPRLRLRRGTVVTPGHFRHFQRNHERNLAVWNIVHNFADGMTVSACEPMKRERGETPRQTRCCDSPRDGLGSHLTSKLQAHSTRGHATALTGGKAATTDEPPPHHRKAREISQKTC